MRCLTLEDAVRVVHRVRVTKLLGVVLYLISLLPSPTAPDAEHNVLELNLFPFFLGFGFIWC